MRRRPNCRWRKAQAAGQEPLRRASPPLRGRPGEGLVSRSSLSNEEAGRRAEGGTGGEDRMEKEKDGQDLGHGKMLTHEKKNKTKKKQNKENGPFTFLGGQRNMKCSKKANENGSEPRKVKLRVKMKVTSSWKTNSRGPNQG